MFFLCGIDEAGRGPLAGPVTAACVCLPHDFDGAQIHDSKELSEREREELFPLITASALAFSVVSIGPRRIELFNILACTKLAMRLAAQRVAYQLSDKCIGARPFFLVDGNASLGTSLEHETIVKGDSKIVSIGAASILAKVSRDRMMELFEKKYPGYGLAKHKGYGTPAHRESIRVLGPSRIHRRTFAGVREFAASRPEL